MNYKKTRSEGKTCRCIILFIVMNNELPARVLAALIGRGGTSISSEKVTDLNREEVGEDVFSSGLFSRCVNVRWGKWNKMG